MALKGLRVVEFAGLAPVPMAGLMLCDFGAEVTRIDKLTSDIAPGWMSRYPFADDSLP